MRLNDRSHRRRAGGGEGGDVGEKTYADICIASPGAWNKGYGFGRGWEGGMAFMFCTVCTLPWPENPTSLGLCLYVYKQQGRDFF